MAEETAADVRRSRLQRLLDGFIVSTSVGFVVAGAALCIAVTPPFSDAYRFQHNAGLCTTLDEIRHGSACVGGVTATVVSARFHVHDGVLSPLITLSAPDLAPQPMTLELSRPSGLYLHGLAAGDTAYLRVWRGRVTTVCAHPLTSAESTCGGFRITDSPIVIDSERLAGGVYTIGMGALLFLVHPPRRFAALIRRRTRWHQPDDTGTLGNVLRTPMLGAAFMTFLGLQILDIVTSVYDGVAAVSFEANPLALLLINAHGAVPGFVAMKLPATIALYLGAARLPRRLALTVMLVGVLVFAYIVLQNVALYQGPGPARAL